MTSVLLLVEFFIIPLLPSTNGQTALIESLPDTSFNASSFWDTTCLPHLSRFSSTSAWSPLTDNTPNEWLQVDLGLDYVITSISTKGNGAHNEFVKTFQLNYATNRNQFSIYSETFQANTNRNDVVENILIPPFIARYLRFYPLTSNAWPSMRVEAFGYIGTLPPTKDLTQSPTPAPTTPTTPTTPSEITNIPTMSPTYNPTKQTSLPSTNNVTSTTDQSVAVIVISVTAGILCLMFGICVFIYGNKVIELQLPKQKTISSFPSLPKEEIKMENCDKQIMEQENSKTMSDAMYQNTQTYGFEQNIKHYQNEGVGLVDPNNVTHK